MPTLLTRWRCALVLLIGALAASLASAALDTQAGTDDHSINVPTDWLTLADVSPQDLAARVAVGNARIVGLDVTAVTGSGEPRFTARLVANQGAYAVPDWWWYHDQSAEQLATLINANQGRLIEIDRYDRGGGQIRYAAVMVANTGAARRDGSYVLGVTREQLVNHMRSTGSRPIDLDGWGTGSARRYNGVFVRNTGTDFRAFDWGTDLTPEQIAARTRDFQGRLVKLGRLPGGRFLFVQVRNTGADASAWWHKVGFASITELDDYARQMGARPIDVASYATASGRRYDAALIDNANAEERRMRGHFGAFIDAEQNPRGIFQSYLKEVGGPVLINLNGQRRAETASALKVLHLLHAMRMVQAGFDTLSSSFTYYDYEDGSANDRKDRCPFPSQELPNSYTGDSPHTSTLEWGLDEMIKHSDNRTTRGVVLRYGGSFGPFNTTAAWAGLGGTTLRHDIGCAYYDIPTKTYRPEALRNETTAADLARVFEGVWTGTLLNKPGSARREFLESTTRYLVAKSELQAVIDQEAAALGKSAIAAQFGDRVKTWGKGGSYGTCLGDPADRTQCGQPVLVLSNVGLLRLPLGGAGPYTAYRHYVFGQLVSDVPYGSRATAEVFAAALLKADAEIFRSVIRAALQTW